MSNFLFCSVIFLILVQFSNTYDPIILPYERFIYDLELFIPVMKQEVEFADLTGMTDDQAYEQLKSFFPTLQYRLQELRNMGLTANENRLKNGENNDKMCGVGHDYYYFKLDKLLKKMNLELLNSSVTAKSSRILLHAMYDGLIIWKRGSTKPCLTKKDEEAFVYR